MLRVLIVSDDASEFESDSLARQLRAQDDRYHATPLPLPPSGCTGATIRAIAALDRTHEFDVLHAIGPSALAAVAAIGCAPIVYTPPADDPLRGGGRLRWVSRFRSVTVTAGSRAARQELIDAGVAPESTCILAAAPPARADAGPSRAELGLEESDRVLLAIGESSRRSNHRLAMHAAVIVHFLDRRFRLLLWGRGPRADAMRRFAGSLKQPDLCVFAEDQLGRAIDWPELCPCADLALFTAARATSPLAARTCLAAGVPILAAPSGIAVELVDSAAIADSPRPRALAELIYGRMSGNIQKRPAATIGAPAGSLDPAELYQSVTVGRRFNFAPGALVPT